LSRVRGQPRRPAARPLRDTGEPPRSITELVALYRSITTSASRALPNARRSLQPVVGTFHAPDARMQRAVTFLGAACFLKFCQLSI
jgi:hypothetical protein